MTGFTWDYDVDGYFSRHRLSNGQFCMVGLYEYNTSRTREYHVAFAVADKKKSLVAWFRGTSKDTISMKMTGRCGIEALCWCRDKLLEFEKEIYRRKNFDTKIVIRAEDSKRFRMYERALARYGYHKVRNGSSWEIIKFVPKENPGG